MKLNNLIILIINLIFLNSIVNSQGVIELQVSSSSGIDTYPCGTNQPCHTIDGALNTYQYMIKYYQQNTPLILNFLTGTYSTFTSQNLTGLNVTFNAVILDSYDAINFSNNLSTPMFRIVNNQQTATHTNIYFNGIRVVNPTYTGIRVDSFLHIDPSNYFGTNQINIEFNQVSIPYGPTSDLVYIDSQAMDLETPQNDWTDGWSTSSVSPFISIGFFNCEFGNDYYTSSFQNPLVYSPNFPISLTVDNSSFTKVIASETLFPLGRSQISFSNIQMSDVLISYKPLFVFVTSQITIRDSSFAGTLENAQFLISFGSFIDFRNNDAQFNYRANSWSQDYPVLDIEKSFATISNSSIYLTGTQVQQSDQGIIYAINSDISLRLNIMSSNISYIINSDGSNFYGYLLSFYQSYSSQYYYLTCSKTHRSTFRGDDSFRNMPQESQNCNYYEQYKNTVSALNFVFVGVACVLLCSAVVCCFKICFEKRKCKKSVDTHTYTPVCDGDITPINPVVPIDSSS
ncbi:hypothetical protein ACTFIV_004133 [Dictyostelium citrinum]